MFATAGAFPLGELPPKETQTEVRWHLILLYKHQHPFQFAQQHCSKHLGYHLSFSRENSDLKSHHHPFYFVSSTFYNPYNVEGQTRSASYGSWPDTIIRFNPQVFMF